MFLVGLLVSRVRRFVVCIGLAFVFGAPPSSANAAPTVPNCGNNHACRDSVADDVVTVYQAQCVPMEYEFWECVRKGGTLHPFGTRTFLVSIQNQTVFEQREFFGPFEYVDCNVIDEDNWSCVCDDESCEIGMRKGKFYAFPTDPLAEERQDDCKRCRATGQVSLREWHQLMSDPSPPP